MKKDRTLDPVGKDCEANLWTMIDVFTKDNVDENEKKIQHKNRNVA